MRCRPAGLMHWTDCWRGAVVESVIAGSSLKNA
jgi:hypothetical protein